uniref:Uncharacterized protein n=1 Tax=Oryza glaberrima TaxID=4538 RepID=I1PQ90_ORYGL
MGGEKGVGRRGKARRRRPPADVAPNDRERSRHGLAHVRGVAWVPTTTAMSSSPARVKAGASASSRWPSSYPGLPPRHDGQLLSPKLIVAPIERLKSRCVQVYYLASRKELATKRELFDSPFTRLPRLSLDRTSRNPKRKELNWLARKEWIATLGELMVLD